MKFQQSLVRAICDKVKEKSEYIKWLAGNINEGWEVWFQIELGARLYEMQQINSYNREEAYPDSEQKADLVLYSKIEGNIPTWVELETQKRRNVDETIWNFFEDCNKIRGIGFNPNQNTAVAIVIVPLNPSVTLAKLYNEWTSRYMRATGVGDFYYYGALTGSFGEFKKGLSQKINDDDILVCCYVHI